MGCFSQCLKLELTWQSSTLVFMTPFMYSFSMVGETPKLFPMHRISVRPSGYVTSTEPFRITDHESSWRTTHGHGKQRFKEGQDKNQKSNEVKEEGRKKTEKINTTTINLVHSQQLVSLNEPEIFIKENHMQ